MLSEACEDGEGGRGRESGQGVVGEIGVGEFGADDVLVSGECEERVGGEGDVVGDGGVVVAGEAGFSTVRRRDWEWRGPAYIMIGIGELSAMAVYQSTNPSCVTTGAKYPGANTIPQSAPASCDIRSCSSVSSIPCVAVPAMMG